jgi:hypothetical protein
MTTTLLKSPRRQMREAEAEEVEAAERRYVAEATAYNATKRGNRG